MSSHPKWATKHKKKGTELRFINGRYYLYEVSSKWDKEKGRARKITGKLLGKITREEGFIESEKALLRKRKLSVSKASTKEYGMTAFIDTHLKEYKTLLSKHFPDHWKQILALVYGRLVKQSPLKNMEHHYLQSYFSEEYKNLTLSPRSLTSLLRDIGVRRDSITNFFKEFKQAKDNILFDGTDLLSKSKKMSLPKLSKSKKGNFESLANIMFVFSIGLQVPVYYRLIPGDIKDIKAFSLCLKESCLKDATVVADKGFYSESNLSELKQEGLKYIIPLRRNNKLIDYTPITSGDKQSFDGFFEYEKRIIWYYLIKDNNKKETIVYMDEELKTQEVKDYLNRIEKLPEEYNLKTFHKKQYSFGTIALMHNTKKKAQEVYLDYKSRGQVEGMIDTMKNTIGADKSYMQNEQALEAWMFINFIAIHWYYKIYQLLIKHNLTSKYSPMDLIMFLSEIRKVKINNSWITAETTKKTGDLLNKLGIHIT